MRPRRRWPQVAAGAVLSALAVTVLLSARPAAAAPDDRAARLAVSRVDVAHWPQIGLVVTPNQDMTLAEVRAGLVVRSGGRTVDRQVTELSPQDLQVVLVPEVTIGPDDVAVQRALLTRLVLNLPPKTQSGVLPTADPTGTPDISADPTGAVRSLATLVPRTAAVSSAARLQAALADFASGSKVRRTVVMVTAADQPAESGIVDHLRRRLAASGTTLFVVDLTRGGSSPLARLAPATGGSVFRPGRSGGIRSALEAAVGPIRIALSHQYYVRFDHETPLPGEIDLVLQGARGRERASVILTKANPVAPPPWVAQPLPLPPVPPPSYEIVLIALGVLLVASSLAYGMSMLVVSRRDPRRFRHAVARATTHSSQDLFYVFLLPCLNEERVVLGSIQRLLSFTGDYSAILVIDDDSDDDTAAVVSQVLSDRVWLLRRKAPEARQGKGEALNAAVRALVLDDRLADFHPDRVIVVIVDADGRLEPTALAEVAPYFADRTVGGVQTGVRINNRYTSLLARMQDMEFVIFTEVFQRGRRHLDSVGLGGNGQFMRLSALLDLGPRPWSRSLTEDLDLGVRLLASGWRNEFCSTVSVHQQGLVDLRRLLRQRTRWFQGHLQSWRLVPLILRRAPTQARADLLYHLSSPLLLLIASLMTASFLVSLLSYAVLLANGRNPAGWWVLSTYLLAFGPAIAYSGVYWTRERQNALSPSGALVLAHVYVGYGLIWYVAGWRAVVRTLRGKASWTKTDRTPDEPVPAVLAGSGARS